MKFKKILPLLVFLGTILGSGWVSASIVNPSAQAIVPNSAIDRAVGVGGFVDYWTFTLGTTSDLYSQVSNFNVFVPGFTIQDITGLTLELNTAIATLDTNHPISYSAVTGDSDFSSTGLSFSSLLAGNYALKVSGTGAGFVGGRYTGTLSAAGISTSSITSVPTPQTWALLLVGGTILIGFQMRRNNLSQDSMLLAA